MTRTNLLFDTVPFDVLEVCSHLVKRVILAWNESMVVVIKVSFSKTSNVPDSDALGNIIFARLD